VARPSVTDERRLQIIDAAGAVIAQRGVCDARIADIANRLGISPALVLYYFPSKDALLAEALTRRDQRFFEAVAEASKGVERASDRLRMVIEASCPPEPGSERHDSEWHLWLEMWSRSRHDPALGAVRARMDGLFRALIAGVVGEGIATGEFDSSVDPERFAIVLTSLIDGLAIQVILGDPVVDSSTMRGLCLDLAAGQLGTAALNSA
jgi:AcrR family transcriptional regulator